MKVKFLYYMVFMFVHVWVCKQSQDEISNGVGQTGYKLAHDSQGKWERNDKQNPPLIRTSSNNLLSHLFPLLRNLYDSDNANWKMWNANWKLLNIYILFFIKSLAFQTYIFIPDYCYYYHCCCFIVNMTFVEIKSFLKLIENNIKVIVLTSFVNLTQAGIILEETASIEEMNSLNCLVGKHMEHFLDLWLIWEDPAHCT